MVFVPAPICCAKYAVFFCPKKGNCKSETPQRQHPWNMKIKNSIRKDLLCMSLFLINIHLIVPTTICGIPSTALI